ncbi:putative DNA-binding transcriptional regulator, partial [Salmonella enterica subsp. enterica serovar Typhimurium]
VIDHEVKEFLYGVPEVRERLSLSLEEEPRADYTPQVHSQPFRQILDAVEKMSPVEQEKLALFLAREGIRNFLARLDIDESA